MVEQTKKVNYCLISKHGNKCSQIKVFFNYVVFYFYIQRGVDMEYVLPEMYKITEELEEITAQKIKAGDIGVIVPGGKGQIPVLFSKGKCLAEAYENSLIALWTKGVLLKTQYDQEGISPSKDCSMTMVIEEPLSEPFIHKAFPGGIEDLEEYRQEVVEGSKNHWTRDPGNPDDNRWEYTYNERMTAYKVPGLEKVINQFENMAQAIAKSPETRRAQIITWQPWMDPHVYDPACWQSLWGRIIRDSAGTENYSDEKGQAYLNLNMRFRSRDAYKASFMNDFGFIHLAKKLAERISEIKAEEVKLGRFIDHSDSFHLYGNYFEEFSNTFVKQLFKRTFEERTMRLNSDIIQTIIEEAKPKIKEKIAEQDKKYNISN